MEEIRFRNIRPFKLPQLTPGSKTVVRYRKRGKHGWFIKCGNSVHVSELGFRAIKGIEKMHSFRGWLKQDRSKVKEIKRYYGDGR